MKEKANFFAILSIIIFSSILRIIVANQILRSDYPILLRGSDSYFYYLRAKDIVAKDILNKKIFISWPFYAFFLAFLLKVSFDNLGFVYFVQLLLGVSNCVLVYIIAKKLLNKFIGFISAIFCSFYSVFMFYESILSYVTFAIFLNLLFLLYLIRLEKKLTKRYLFFAGILASVCFFTQGNLFLFSLLAVVILLYKKKLGLLKSIRFYFVFLSGFFLIVLSVAIFNYLIDKDILFGPRNVGINFYIGNNKDADGLFKVPLLFGNNQEAIYRDSKIIAKQVTKKDLKDSEALRFWARNAFVFIRKYPFKYLSLVFKKIKYAFSPSEYFCDPQVDLFFENSRVLKFLFRDLYFIMPLALVGIVISVKKINKLYLLYLFVFSVMLSLVLFFVSTKNRIAFVPILSIFSAIAIYKIYELIKIRRKIFEGLCLIIFLFTTFLVINKDTLVSKKNFIRPTSYYLGKATIYVEKKNYEKALESLDIAARLNSSDPYLLFSFGTLCYEFKDFKKAEKYFKEAIKHYPFFIDAYYNLGFMFNLQKRYKEAEIVLKKAIEYEPDDFAVHFELARSYEAMGKIDLALSHYNQSLLKINRWRISEIEIIKKNIENLIQKRI